jgi:ketol-acid reductoisomerase
MEDAMTVNIFHEADVDPALIKAKKVAVIGYGSQGHAHALNLRDSGCDVRVGLRAGSASWALAQEAGLRVAAIDEAAEEADLVMVLVPD